MSTVTGRIVPGFSFLTHVHPLFSIKGRTKEYVPQYAPHQRIAADLTVMVPEVFPVRFVILGIAVEVIVQNFADCSGTADSSGTVDEKSVRRINPYKAIDFPERRIRLFIDRYGPAVIIILAIPVLADHSDFHLSPSVLQYRSGNPNRTSIRRFSSFRIMVSSAAIQTHRKHSTNPKKINSVDGL